MYPSGLSILLSLCTFWHSRLHLERGRKSRKSAGWAKLPGELVVNIPLSPPTTSHYAWKTCWAATGMQRRHADGLRSQSGLPDTPGHIRAALGLLLVFVAIDLICNGAGIAYIKESTIILVISG